MKKKYNKLYKKIIFIIISITLIGLSIILIKQKNNFINLSIKDKILKVESFLTISNTKQELEQLRQENENLKLLKQENIELKEEIKTIKNILNIDKLLSDKDIIYASITNRNLDYWNETININKGTNDGINKNMAVTYSGCLIGIISNSQKENSTVSLLINDKIPQNLSVKMKINDNYVYGILNKYKDGYYEIIGVVENIDIKKDTIVITSGLSNNIPSGIEIGKVEEVITDNFDLTKIVKVKPNINFDKIDYVTVIKGDLW